MDDPLCAAMATVPYDAYVLESDGTPVRESSTPEIVANVLRLLEAKPGERILEVGTGSGYSAALLAQIVGAVGHVVSLDVEPSVTYRARERFARTNITNVALKVADGRAGYSDLAPYDRIVAWATAEVLPHAWLAQLRPLGTLVAPVRVLPLGAHPLSPLYEGSVARLATSSASAPSRARSSHCTTQDTPRRMDRLSRPTPSSGHSLTRSPGAVRRGYNTETLRRGVPSPLPSPHSTLPRLS